MRLFQNLTMFLYVNTVFQYFLHMLSSVQISRSVLSDSLRPHGLQPASFLCSQGFSRQEYWSGLPCPPPGDVPNPGIEPRSPALQTDSLPSESAACQASLPLTISWSLPKLMSVELVMPSSQYRSDVKSSRQSDDLCGLIFCVRQSVNLHQNVQIPKALQFGIFFYFCSEKVKYSAPEDTSSTFNKEPDV